MNVLTKWVRDGMYVTPEGIGQERAKGDEDLMPKRTALALQDAGMVKLIAAQAKERQVHSVMAPLVETPAAALAYLGAPVEKPEEADGRIDEPDWKHPLMQNTAQDQDEVDEIPEVPDVHEDSEIQADEDA